MPGRAAAGNQRLARPALPRAVTAPDRRCCRPCPLARRPASWPSHSTLITSSLLTHPLLAQPQQPQQPDDESGRLLREASPFYSYSVTAGRFSAGPEDPAAAASLHQSSSNNSLSSLDSPAGPRRHHARQYSGGVPEQYSAATPPRHSFASRHSAAGGGLRVGAAPSLPGPGGC